MIIKYSSAAFLWAGQKTNENIDVVKLERLNPLFVIGFKYVIPLAAAVITFSSVVSNFDGLRNQYCYFDLLLFAVVTGIWAFFRGKIKKVELDAGRLIVGAIGFLLILLGALIYNAMAANLLLVTTVVTTVYWLAAESAVELANGNFKNYYRYIEDGKVKAVAVKASKPTAAGAKLVKIVKYTAITAGLIAILALTAIGARAYKTYLAETKTKAEKVRAQSIRELELQSEKNRTAYIIWHHDKIIDKDLGTRELNAKLKVNLGYRDTKEVTYPWDSKYPGRGNEVVVEGVVYE
jgi:preprotein translocase subunit Sss1